MDIKTILVAEDTDSNFALVSVLLRKDYEIIRAMNGEEAIQLYLDVHPDLILMDIQMPVLNGFDATRKIRALDKNIPIIALTAFAFDSDKKTFIDAGGSSYMPKPIDTYALKALIREYI
jgi:two-component system, cell cycle response regulator DivK